MSKGMLSEDPLKFDYSTILNLSLSHASLGVAPIFVNSWRPKWESVGTCFLATYRKNLYLITARHVLEVAFKNKQVAAIFFGKLVFFAWALLYRKFRYRSGGNDVALGILGVSWH